MSVPQGAVDIHVHADPSFFNRKHDAIELATEMKQAGFDGLMLKSHFYNTHPVAELVTRSVSGIDIYSSVVLNSFVGGFNPTAVEYAIETDVDIIWLPTFSAANHSSDRYYPFSNQSLRATDKNGKLLSSVIDVLDCLENSDRSVTLGNGHLSKSETFAVFNELESRGLNNDYLITHADFDFMGLSMEDQIALANRGAVIEKCYLPVVKGDVTIDDVVQGIRAIGPEQCVLSTDHGQIDNPTPSTA
jgi:hypothetical protein